jgi:hypothetical protein
METSQFTLERRPTGTAPITADPERVFQAADEGTKSSRDDRRGTDVLSTRPSNAPGPIGDGYTANLAHVRKWSGSLIGALRPKRRGEEER